jgi:hypothetical protein
MIPITISVNERFIVAMEYPAAGQSNPGQLSTP